MLQCATAWAIVIIMFKQTITAIIEMKNKVLVATTLGLGAVLTIGVLTTVYTQQAQAQALICFTNPSACPGANGGNGGNGGTGGATNNAGHTGNSANSIGSSNMGVTGGGANGGNGGSGGSSTGGTGALRR
jgi:hypothetical protein